MAISRDISTNISGQVTATTANVRIEETIAWTDLPSRLAEIFGPTTSSGIVASELDPLFGLWRAQSVDFEPRTERMTDTVAGASAGDPTMPKFQYAALVITYSTLEQESPTSQDEADQDGQGDPVPFLTHSWSIGGDFITMDDAEMYWSNGQSAKATGIAANKIIPTIEHSINWKRVLNPPFDELRNCLGKVNSKPMTFSTGKIYPECLLFNGAELSRDIMSDGTRAWDVTYRFSERRVDATLRSVVSGGSIYTYDGVGPAGQMSSADRTVSQAGADAINTGNPSELSLVAGQYGGWNHFYKKDSSPGMRRLHQSQPASYPELFRQSTAIYKKYDLLKLFTQDS